MFGSKVIIILIILNFCQNTPIWVHQNPDNFRMDHFNHFNQLDIIVEKPFFYIILSFHTIRKINKFSALTQEGPLLNLGV